MRQMHVPEEWVHYTSIKIEAKMYCSVTILEYKINAVINVILHDTFCLFYVINKTWNVIEYYTAK